MITAEEARKQVNQEMTDACNKQMKQIEESLSIAIKNKQTSFTIVGSLLPPVRATLITPPLCYEVKEYEEQDRQTYTVTQISF